MSTGRVIGIVIGSLVLLTGLVLVLCCGGVLVAERVLADPDGFVSVRSGAIDQETHAVVAAVSLDGPLGFWRRSAVTLRVEVEGRGADAKPVFVGVADRFDAERYLAGVAVAKIRNVRFGEDESTRRPRLEYDVKPGTTVPAEPATQDIWIESASGAGPKSVDWRLMPGDYRLVVMNADASSGIHVTATVGARAPFVLTIATIMLGVGAVFLILGLAAIVVSARGAHPAAPGLPAAAAGGSAAGGSGFPLSLKVEYTESLSPVLWLVKWFLLIPHFVILGFLWMGFACSWGLALLAILFTGRYPRGLFEYNVGVMRWTWRVGFYGYQALGTDEYPPFTLRAGGYPADLDVAYPDKLSRGLALVKWWLLAIPHYLILAILVGAGPHWGGLVIVLTFVAGILLLFTSRYPREIFPVIVGANRWALRVLAYVALMTDVYPPFRIEE